MQQTQLINSVTERVLPRPARTAYGIGKRVFDIVVASLILIIVCPVMLLIALLILIDSEGPVFFKQERVGLGGQGFTFYKFRTMRQNSPSDVHREYVQSFIRSQGSNGETEQKTRPDPHKLANDPRITRVGRVLRRTSLDEIPQFFNVLRGEMSLVGPRPPLPYEVQVYQDWHKARLAAIPGITGLWQVQGRSRVTFDEMVRMDLEYITHQTFWLDIKILILTIPAVISGAGAR